MLLLSRLFSKPPTSTTRRATTYKTRWLQPPKPTDSVHTQIKASPKQPYLPTAKERGYKPERKYPNV